MESKRIGTDSQNKLSKWTLYSRDAAGQKILTRGSGRVFCLSLGSGRVGLANFPKVDGSGRAGSALKNSGTGRVGSKFGQKNREVGKLFFQKKTHFNDISGNHKVFRGEN